MNTPGLKSSPISLDVPKFIFYGLLSVSLLPALEDYPGFLSINLSLYEYPIKEQPVIIGMVDDDQVFIHLLVNALCRDLRRKVAFCSNNGYDLIKYATIYKPDILVVDLYMPLISGMEAVLYLKRSLPAIKIVAYASIFRKDILLQLKNIPVEAYCKNIPPDIEHGVEWLEKGGTWFNESYYVSWQNTETREFNSRANITEKLSATEIRIILLTADGKTNNEIAGTLHLSKRTIDTYIGNMLEKLDLGSKNDLIKFAFQNDICTVNCSSVSKNFCAHHSFFSIKSNNNIDVKTTQ